MHTDQDRFYDPDFPNLRPLIIFAVLKCSSTAEKRVAREF